MLLALATIFLASFTTILQIAFFSHLGFPWSSISFPLLAAAYGALRDRPILALGWSLIAGTLLDLHGLLGFGAETAALFFSFFATRHLFKRVLTNAGAPACFLLGAFAAIAHWFFLAAIDGASVLSGGIPTTTDISLGAALAPLRQAIVSGTAFLCLMAVETAVRRRFHRIFISHASNPVAFS